ncbi:Tyr recombinase domain-containing protein [Flavobacterium longum]|uniref:tyrosine-type recombinase/integrase n=1 Tax=Flavobacterium longum TaxID=1299340 RepID=UPI0039EB886D
MKYTFYLKEPNAVSETLIMFSCFFKNENRKFVYSTGEKIQPLHWDKQARQPKTNGKHKSKFADAIKMQLNRYSDLLLQTESLYKRINEELTSNILKKVFDEEFKKLAVGRNVFFDAFDEFVLEKVKSKDWSAATEKRYINIRNILMAFQDSKNYPLTFNSINKKFHTDFTSYCMDDLKHINNTYARNLGLFKSFLYWSLDKKYTFNTEFMKFKKVERVVTNQIALTIDDLNKILTHNFESKRLEKVRDVFVFACVTGMRFGELATIKKSNVTTTDIILKEEKEKGKEARKIPLTTISKFLLAKYNYELPLIANQKQNKYLKEVFRELNYSQLVQKVTTRGKENIKEEMFFYDRISTHTARRTFITMMKRQGKSDKLIASITGHSDMKTLNQYYQVDNDEKKEAMDEVFALELPMRTA